MVGIVLVSHSRALADALVNLVRQMTGPAVKIAIAAGIGPERSEFGTDATEVVDAVQSVFDPDGVAVLMDLGSAVLSAEMALEFIPEEMRSKVRFCAAPMIEGAIAAAVQASLGSDLETVCREAAQALQPKLEQLGAPQEAGGQPPAEPAAEAGQGEAIQAVVALRNPHGLHARPAAKFVQTAAQFDADIWVRNLTTDKKTVSARSLNALATLGAVQNDRIEIVARGPQAQAAVDALVKLAQENFGEGTGPAAAPEPGPEAAPRAAAARRAGEKLPEGAIPVVPVSPGIAIGPAVFFRPAAPKIPDEPVRDPDKAWDSLQRAVNAVEKSIAAQRDRISVTVGSAEGSIFDAHLLILRDPELLEQAHRFISEEHRNPAAAWHAAIQQAAEAYRRLEDPYLRGRAADVEDVGSQVLQALLGDASQAAQGVAQLTEPSILCAMELTPTQTAQLDLEKVLGMVTTSSGPTSHSSILARAMGIPSVTGVDPSLQTLPRGTPLALDGSEGLLWTHPSPQTIADLQERQARFQEQQKRQKEGSREPAVTRDGRRVLVFANVGGVVEVRKAMANGAEGIGLLRTEFLYLTRETPPTETEQADVLRQIAQNAGDLPVVVRTMDIGGDKALPYLKQAAEANPFLGVRAIRLSLREPELFRTQLRAILRAGASADLRVMFPMIASLEEVFQVRQVLEQAHLELAEAKTPHKWPVETGIMIEIPSAALLARALARHVDFFSIGTNDLTQYTLAAERGNPALAGLADALHPAVLNLIASVVQGAHAEGRTAAVCGELGGDPQAIPILVGLGVDELSMNAGAIPAAKGLVRMLQAADTQRLAADVLRLESAAAVREKAAAFLKQVEG